MCLSHQQLSRSFNILIQLICQLKLLKPSTPQCLIHSLKLSCLLNTVVLNLISSSSFLCLCLFSYVFMENTLKRVVYTQPSSIQTRREIKPAIHSPESQMDFERLYYMPVWEMRVEKPSSVAFGFQVFSIIQGKTKARDFCYFSSETLQSL